MLTLIISIINVDIDNPDNNIDNRKVCPGVASELYIAFWIHLKLIS